MSTSLKRGRLLAAGVVGLTALLAGPPAQARQDAPVVPTELQVTDGSSVFLVGHAVGVQIYACDPTPSGAAWTLVAPRASLYGDNGRLIATHFGGPTWQAGDGSRVVGHREAGVTMDPTAVAWLKLSAASTASGPDGDRLLHTTFVQRVNTVGGLPPTASSCDPTSVGSQAEVPYSADYYFWK